MISIKLWSMKATFFSDFFVKKPEKDLLIEKAITIIMMIRMRMRIERQWEMNLAFFLTVVSLMMFMMILYNNWFILFDLPMTINAWNKNQYKSKRIRWLDKQKKHKKFVSHIIVHVIWFNKCYHNKNFFSPPFVSCLFTIIIDNIFFIYLYK